jgi:hypothetical protein
MAQPISSLASKYFIVYKELGGTAKEKDIENDFLIVAAASIKSLDVVVSEDNKTMKDRTAMKSYEIVNKLNGLRTPEFIGYELFKKLLGSPPDKFPHSSPKLWVFNIPFVLLPYLFSVHNNHIVFKFKKWLA